MSYDEQILRILNEVGQRGISVKMLAKHVYNMNCTLFEQPELAEVHRYVQQYLLRNSKAPQSLLERMEVRGHYRLNIRSSAEAQQLMLQFLDQTEEQEAEEDTPPAQQDFSLSLF